MYSEFPSHMQEGIFLQMPHITSLPCRSTDCDPNDLGGRLQPLTNHLISCMLFIKENRNMNLFKFSYRRIYYEYRFKFLFP